MGSVVKNRWWANVERTRPPETVEIQIPIKPSLEDRIETMRRINCKIVNHQCEIARLEGQLDDEKAGMLAELQDLNSELRFLK
jgi:hypothetical protein